MSVPFKKYKIRELIDNKTVIFVIVDLNAFLRNEKIVKMCVCDYSDQKWFLLVLLAHRLYRTQSIQIAVEIPPTRIVIERTIEANSPDPCLILGARCAGTPNFVSSTMGSDGWISCMLICSIILNLFIKIKYYIFTTWLWKFPKIL